MLIDEDKVGTPHWINEEKEVVYTDHCVMTMEMKIDMKGKNKTVSKYMSKDGYERFGTEIKEQQISEILDPDDFDRTYQEWSDIVISVSPETEIEFIGLTYVILLTSGIIRCLLNPSPPLVRPSFYFPVVVNTCCSHPPAPWFTHPIPNPKE